MRFSAPVYAALTLLAATSVHSLSPPTNALDGALENSPLKTSSGDIVNKVPLVGAGSNGQTLGNGLPTPFSALDKVRRLDVHPIGVTDSILPVPHVARADLSNAGVDAASTITSASRLAEAVQAAAKAQTAGLPFDFTQADVLAGKVQRFISMRPVGLGGAFDSANQLAAQVQTLADSLAAGQGVDLSEVNSLATQVQEEAQSKLKSLPVNLATRSELEDTVGAAENSISSMVAADSGIDPEADVEEEEASTSSLMQKLGEVAPMPEARFFGVSDIRSDPAQVLDPNTDVKGALGDVSDIEAGTESMESKMRRDILATDPDKDLDPHVDAEGALNDVNDVVADVKNTEINMRRDILDVEGVQGGAAAALSSTQSLAGATKKYAAAEAQQAPGQAQALVQGAAFKVI